ncbi:hypothetical protein ACIRPK_36465 [Kitasatospora sp. NPDC101801]|uniref:hypothetical protein n=1 Tax=Kitasatospora sp. NPDC101801 TaxID=3364103 RepID=UPI0037F5FB1D
MTTTSHLERPARRRRHARLVASLTDLVGACAEAAAEIYRPLASALPGQQAVDVAAGLLYVRIGLTAPLVLDRARAEDDERWPGALAQEQREAQRTYAARVVVATAQDLTGPDSDDDQADQGDRVEAAGPAGAGLVAVPTVEQGAAMELVAAGSEVAERWREDPAEAAVLALELAESGEFTTGEVLDAAVDERVVAGLLALQEARTAPDPSTAAELCLAAVPHLVLAVHLASADLD